MARPHLTPGGYRLPTGMGTPYPQEEEGVLLVLFTAAEKGYSRKLGSQ